MKVLVCERDRASAALIQERLEHQGYEVDAATDLAESLRRVRTEPTEFVILDGVGIGLEPLHALRDAPWTADVPCLVLTACPDDRWIFEAYRAGADIVWTKPFNPQELVTFRRRD